MRDESASVPDLNQGVFVNALHGFSTGRLVVGLDVLPF